MVLSRVQATKRFSKGEVPDEIEACKIILLYHVRYWGG